MKDSQEATTVQKHPRHEQEAYHEVHERRTAGHGFVDQFLTEEGESVEDAKKRLRAQTSGVKTDTAEKEE